MIITSKQYDNYIVNTMQTLESQIEQWLENPKVTKNKSDVELYHDWTLIDDIKYTDDAKIHRIGKNVAYYNSIILDYDDGDFTIEDAQSMFSKYLSYGYTSYSHKPHRHKFRVVLPLKKYIPSIILRQHRERITKKFPGVDQSTLYCGRMFFKPACQKQNIKYYQCWKTKGTNYVLRGDYQVKEEKKIPLLRIDDNFVTKKIKEYKNNIEIQKCIDKLEKINFYNRGHGIVHDTLLKINARMYYAGIDEETRLEIMLAYAIDSNSKREIEDIVLKTRIE